MSKNTNCVFCLNSYIVNTLQPGMTITIKYDTFGKCEKCTELFRVANVFCVKITSNEITLKQSHRASNTVFRSRYLLNKNIQ